jgi:hypothetical protein
MVVVVVVVVELVVSVSSVQIGREWRAGRWVNADSDNHGTVDPEHNIPNKVMCTISIL